MRPSLRSAFTPPPRLPTSPERRSKDSSCGSLSVGVGLQEPPFQQQAAVSFSRC